MHAPAGLAPIAAAGALCWLAPLPASMGALRADLHRDGDPLAAAVHLIALGAWALVGWLAVATGAALAARIPGATGRAAGALAGRITPALLRQALGTGAAIGLALSPALTPTAAHAAACAPGRLPSLDRAAPACATAPATAPAVTTPADPPAPSYTVVAGDTLWGLAATELRRAGQRATARQVADRWPAWWRANRAVIGDDPDLIRIGTVLTLPDPMEKTG
ncbi:MAG TPA: LysM domain-containing protein [Mycobacteriales bacterium]